MESREKSLARGRSEIASLVSQLQIPGPLNLIESAHRYYVLALSKNFTRGRRTAQAPFPLLHAPGSPCVTCPYCRL